MRAPSLFSLAIAALAAGCAPAVEGRTAFIGAEGHGRGTVGGFGGTIIKVTTLDDSGPGSLRACIEADMPRVCVFEVGGLIRFTSRRPAIRNPYITIAGETAPGDGIILSHLGGDEGITPLTIKETHDVIIRHIRVRTDMRGDNRGGNDGITIDNSRNIVIDHVSTSWALDENIGGWGKNDNITISWSIFAEGIPGHDKCALLASDPDGPQNISFVRNLCAHNGDRNPDVNVPPDSCVDVINNVFYNAQSQFTEVWESYGGSPVNIVGNYYRRGPDTNRRMAAAIDRPTTGSRGLARIYADDNEVDGVPLTTSTVSSRLVDDPVCDFKSDVVSASDAYNQVLSGAGAFPRDDVDVRVVDEVRNRAGRIRREPGRMPPLSPGRAYTDEDGDGMSDAWEAQNDADPATADPWEDPDGDGWTHMDQFLHFAHLRRLEGKEVY